MCFLYLYIPCFEEVYLNIRNQSGCFCETSFLKAGLTLFQFYFRKTLAEDKNGITVSLVADGFMEAESDKEAGIVDFGSQNVRERKSATLTITYHNDGKMKMTTCKLMDNCDAFYVEDEFKVAAGETVS